MSQLTRYRSVLATLAGDHSVKVNPSLARPEGHRRVQQDPARASCAPRPGARNWTCACQPIEEIISGSIAGYEALVRWQLQSVASLRRPAPSRESPIPGPRGVGKQRLALWLAQLLLCENNPRPCGKCRHCEYARNLTHPDLHWYFPRPRLKDADPDLEDVRDDYRDAVFDRVSNGRPLRVSPRQRRHLRRDGSRNCPEAAISPAMAKRKVFIIGDAERMVPQEGADMAANAFLKLLEEPSEKTTIILTSSEPGALLPTIRSRAVAVSSIPYRLGGARIPRRPAGFRSARQDRRSKIDQRARTARWVRTGHPVRGRSAWQGDGVSAKADRGNNCTSGFGAIRRRTRRRRGGRARNLHRHPRFDDHHTRRTDASGTARWESGARGCSEPRSRGRGSGKDQGWRQRQPAAHHIESPARPLRSSQMTKLSHTDESGNARMVDVSGKNSTIRVARATGSIRMSQSTLDVIRANGMKKGDVLGVAKIAGIMAAKKTSDLIPLCHPIQLTDIGIELTLDDSLPGVRAESHARTTGQTGVEMEALTAVAVALLTVYDMAKAIDRGMTITGVALLEKSGGASGDWTRSEIEID